MGTSFQHWVIFAVVIIGALKWKWPRVQHLKKSKGPVTPAEIAEARNKWSVPEDLAQNPAPRKMHETAYLRSRQVSACMALAGFLFLGFWNWFHIARVRHAYDVMETVGLSTTGQVIEIHPEKHHFSVQYRYTVQGRVFQRKALLGSAAKSWTPGTPVKVLYANQQPEKGFLSAQKPVAHNGILLFYVGVAGLLAFAISRGADRTKSILRYGTVTVGIVTKIANTRFGTVVTYQFHEQSGNTVKGRSLVERANRPSLGDPVTVLYLADAPRKNCVYPIPGLALERDRWMSAA